MLTPLDREWLFVVFRDGGAYGSLLQEAYEVERRLSSVLLVDRLTPAGQSIQQLGTMEGLGFVRVAPGATPGTLTADCPFVPVYDSWEAWEMLARHWPQCPSCGHHEAMRQHDGLGTFVDGERLTPKDPPRSAIHLQCALCLHDATIDGWYSKERVKPRKPSRPQPRPLAKAQPRPSNEAGPLPPPAPKPLVPQQSLFDLGPRPTFGGAR